MATTSRTRSIGSLGCALLSLTLLLSAGLAACSVGGDSKSSSGPPPTAVGSGGTLTGGEKPAADGAAGAPSVPDGRKVIITITVGVQVPDVATAVDKVIALAARYGGSLSASAMDLLDPHTASGDLVFRVPPEHSDQFILALDPGIGRRTSLQTGTKDVTLQLTDLDARIITARASLDRVRSLLASAKNIGEVITLEGELTNRQNTLEQLEAQKTDLAAQVAMATVTVHLSGTNDAGATPSHRTGVGAAFHKGWQAFLNALHGIAVFVGYTAPFLVLIGAGLLVWWWLNRRRAARRNRSAAPLLPPAPVEDQRTTAHDSASEARSH